MYCKRPWNFFSFCLFNGSWRSLRIHFDQEERYNIYQLTQKQRLSRVLTWNLSEYWLKGRKLPSFWRSSHRLEQPAFRKRGTINPYVAIVPDNFIPAERGWLFQGTVLYFATASVFQGKRPAGFQFVVALRHNYTLSQKKILRDLPEQLHGMSQFWISNALSKQLLRY